MDEKEIKLTAQLMAIEHLLAGLYAISHVLRGHSLEQIKSMHKLQLERARSERFPSAEPRYLITPLVNTRLNWSGCCAPSNGALEA